MPRSGQKISVLAGDVIHQIGAVGNEASRGTKFLPLKPAAYRTGVRADLGDVAVLGGVLDIGSIDGIEISFREEDLTPLFVGPLVENEPVAREDERFAHLLGSALDMGIGTPGRELEDDQRRLSTKRDIRHRLEDVDVRCPRPAHHTLIGGVFLHLGAPGQEHAKEQRTDQPSHDSSHRTPLRIFENQPELY